MGSELPGLRDGRQREAGPRAGDGIPVKDSQDAQSLWYSGKEYAPGCTARQSTRAGWSRGSRCSGRAEQQAQGAASPILSQHHSKL